MAKIEIYTSPFCGFCFRAKNLLSSKGIDFEEIDVESVEGAREEMTRRTGGKTSVPQIFSNEVHVGDCDDIYFFESIGELDRKLGRSVV